jgi:hypothetical protein
MRTIEWTWDPDPTDDVYMTEYAFLMRDGTEMKSFHDRHIEGVFSRATWIRILEEVGYRVELISRPLGEGEFDEVFFCRR